MELGSTDMVTLVILVVTGYIATNIDNLLLLVVLQGANITRRRDVLWGFFCASVAVIIVSLLGVVAGTVTGGKLVGYLGLVPLVLGCYMLFDLVRKNDDADLPDASLAADGNRTVWFSTFLLLFSNSGDSIAVFLPLLAESRDAGPWLIVSSFLVMTLLWVLLSSLIVGQRTLAASIEKRARKIVPWVMIGVGIYILMDTPTDTLL